jgi:hypothetical protein
VKGETIVKKTFRKELSDGSVLVASVRFDDECKNGHNTFTIMADLYEKTRRNGEQSSESDYVVNSRGKKRYLTSCGCQHDLVAVHFPELAPLIKWHLTSTDGPTFYVADTVYHAQKGRLDYARRSAIAPDATLAELGDESWLLARLPALMVEFRAAVESLGFVYEEVSK